MPPRLPLNREIYDLTMDKSDDEVDRRSVVPEENWPAQLIDLTERDETPPRAELAQPPQSVGPQNMPPAVIMVQPLSLYWKMCINRGINTYHTGKLEWRDMNEVVTTSIGINGPITLTVKDFCGLIKIRDPGFVNDNIIDAFLQTLDVFSRHHYNGINGLARISPHSVFLSTQILDTLEKATTLAEKDAAYHKKVLRKVLDKHGVTSANLSSVENVFLPVHLRSTDPKNQHWVLAIWHPRRHCLTWWDSAMPQEGGPRSRFAEVDRSIRRFWADFCRSEVPQPNGPSKVVEVDQSAWEVRDIKCPQQENTSDCGVFVMAACLCIVLKFNAFITGEGRRNLMRTYLAAVLLQQGWGGELPWGIPSPTIMPPRHYEEEISPLDPTYLRI